MDKLVEALAQAYVGEGQARNRYTMYSKIAKKEGYIRVSQLFSETAEHEKTHGKNYFKMIQKVMKKLGKDEKMIELDGVGVPLEYGTTIENLKESINGEQHESTEMYPEIAKIAEEQGFGKIAAQVLAIAKAEEHHEKRYSMLLEQIEKATMFKKDDEVWWFCIECGYWHHAKEPPKVC